MPTHNNGCKPIAIGHLSDSWDLMKYFKLNIYLSQYSTSSEKVCSWSLE